MSDCVYVIQADNGDVKIGVSGTPYARLSKIKAEYGSRRQFTNAYLVGYAITDYGMTVESFAQRELEEYAVGGEWFKVNSLIAFAKVAEVAMFFDDLAIIHTVGPEDIKISKKIFRTFIKNQIPNFKA